MTTKRQKYQDVQTRTVTKTIYFQCQDIFKDISYNFERVTNHKETLLLIICRV